LTGSFTVSPRFGSGALAVGQASANAVSAIHVDPARGRRPPALATPNFTQKVIGPRHATVKPMRSELDAADALARTYHPGV
jgi:hypothetical protein